ncbi:MAG TPA: MauE/DoxX family redox-associated membrane protein [Blastocatellia bacterium]
MQTFKIVMKFLFAASFILAGFNHFRDHDFYMRIMPPYLPWHSALHLTAGVFEIVLGVMLLIHRFQILAAWGLIALLLAFFSVHIHMIVHHDQYEVGLNLLWIRFFLQFVLIALAWWFTKVDGEEVLKYEPQQES